MIDTYYFCLDDKALAYAKKHLANGYTQVMRCYTVLEMNIAIRTINTNKSKKFYSLRCGDKKFLKCEVKNLEVLAKEMLKVD